MCPSRTNPGVAHEKGSIESPPGHLKRRVELLRGSHEFDSVVPSQAWLEGVVDKTTGRNQKRIE